MSSISDVELSAAELRSKLFQSFKNKGILQSVQSQLRKQLALELHEKATKFATQKKETKHDNSLIQRLCNSLLIDHLKKCSYDYTLSVFMTETHSSLEECLPFHDMLKLLNVNSQSQLFVSLDKEYSNSKNMKGFLWSFLKLLSQHHGHQTTESSVQTDMKDPSPSLDKKIFEIEKAELERHQSVIKNDHESIEAKVLAFQRRYEAQKQSELKREIEKFRTTEIANLKLEEREKCQKELLQMKMEYERKYDSKLKDLDRREMEINARALKQEKEVEKNCYEQRQKILDEMEALKLRDLELKRNHKSSLNAVEIEEEKLKSKEELLKSKEKTMKELEEQYENKLKHEILKIKIELEEKDIEKVTQMEDREQQLREEKMNFQSQKDIYLKWKDEADKLRGENDKLNISVISTKKEYDILCHKYEQLIEQLEGVKNYSIIKNENMVLQKELEICKKSFTDVSLEKAKLKKEHHKLVQDMFSRVNQNPPELKSLRESEQALKLKYEVLLSQHELLKKSHINQLQKNEELRKLYEAMLLSHKELLRECDDLKLNLHFATQEKQNALQVQNSISQLPKHTVPVSKKIISSESHNRFTTSCNDVMKEWSFEIDKNQVLNKLEEEAVELEKSYKLFQERQLLYNVPASGEISKSTLITTTFATTTCRSAVADKNSYVPLQLESFSLNHPISSRTMPESNVAVVPSCSSQAVVFSNYLSTAVPKMASTPLSAEHANQTPISIANSQLDLALAKIDAWSHQSIDISTKHSATNQISNIHSDPDLNPNKHVFSNAQSHLTALKCSTIKSSSGNEVTDFEKSGNISNHTTQTPMKDVEAKSLTQLPLIETMKHSNSLTQLPLTETIQHGNSLTQLPLTDTMQQIESPHVTLTETIISPKPLPTFVESTQSMEPLTQLPVQTKTQFNSTLTQFPLMETPYPVKPSIHDTSIDIALPIDTLTQMPLSGTTVNSVSLSQIPLKTTYETMETESKVNEDDKNPLILNLKVGVASRSEFDDETLKAALLETLDSRLPGNFNVQNDGLNSETDIFKTSDFMLKGFQSTRLDADELQAPTNKILEGVLQYDLNKKDDVELQRHSTPDVEKHINVESIQNFSDKPQHSTIEKENDSSDAVSAPLEFEDDENNPGSIHTLQIKNEKPAVVDDVVSDNESGRSDGEISRKETKKENDGVKSEEVVVQENPMEQYMKMILAQREVKNDAKDNEIEVQADITQSLHQDIPASEVDEKDGSTRSSNTDFEW